MIFQFSEIELDPNRRELRRGGQRVAITPKELDVLLHLVRNRDRVVSKTELLDTVWNDVAVTESSLTRAVSKLRTLLRRHGTGPDPIRTLSRRGYRFEAEVRVTTTSTEARRNTTTASAERRQVAVLACELQEAHSREIDLEVENACAGILQRLHGHLIRRDAGKLVYVFGYPRSLEDNAGAAQRAARELLKGLQVLTASLRVKTPSLPDLSRGVRLAIHIDFVEIGHTATALDLPPDVEGVLTRLLAAARPGRPALSPRAAETKARNTKDTDREAHESEETTRFDIIDDDSFEPRPAERRLATTAPFVGRQAEIDRLRQTLGLVRMGKFRALLIAGEPGIGKSRLVRQLRENLDLLRHTWLTVRCDPESQGAAMSPLVELAARNAVDAQGASPVGELLNVDDTATSNPWSGAATRTRIREALTSWLRARACEGSFVLEIEDLQWADALTLDLLAHWCQQPPEAPILLLMTARGGFVVPWRMGDAMETIALAPLPRAESEQMLRSLLAADPPAAVLTKICDQSAGVPLYIECLAEACTDTPEASYAGNLPIPVTLRDGLTARVDTLGSDRGVIRYAAVIGREFQIDLLLRLGPFDIVAVEEAIRRAVRAAIVEPDVNAQAGTYRFTHALLHEATYESVPASLRAELHGKAAALIEEIDERMALIYPERLARHHTHAENLSSAAFYWERAANNSLRHGAYKDAAHHAETALDLVRRLPRDRERVVRELSLHALLGQALLPLHGHASERLDRLHDSTHQLCNELGRSLETLPALASIYSFRLNRSELAAAGAIADEVESLTREIAVSILDVISHSMSAAPRFFAGHLAEAALRQRQAVGAYDADQHAALASHFGQDPGVTALTHLSRTVTFLGELTEAESLIRKALALEEAPAHPLSRVQVVFHAAALRARVGDAGGAGAFARELLSLSEDNAFPMYKGLALTILGFAAVHSGAADEGIEQLRQGALLYESTGATLESGEHRAWLAEGLLARGKHDEGENVLIEALAQCAATGVRYYEPELWRLRGLCLAARPPAQQRWDRSFEECLHTGLRLAHEQTSRLWELRLTLELARSKGHESR